jgi:hypothetical protein
MARAKLKKTMAIMAAPAVDQDWQVENDLRTIQSAAEVMADPKRLAACKAKHADQMAGMQKMMSQAGKVSGGKRDMTQMDGEVKNK